ncbi:MAG TPA: cytochrome c [Rhizomicrobium sp.]|jgi:mono/diheme cytochrome c family protein
MNAILDNIRNWYLGLTSTMRGVLIAVTAIVIVGVVAFIWIAGGPGPMEFASGQKVALADYHGADPTGAPASMKSASLVQRGEYLARAADCMVCHTAKGETPYAGGFAFTLPFGTIYSTNITPDKETGIGNYTDAQFLAAVHRGVRADGKRLYPAMPFASYTYMTDADALAIKAYLFSLAPVHAPAKTNTMGFPFNQRWAMGIWSAFFNADKRFRPDTAHSPEWNRGAYIAEALAHCGECHTPRNIAYALNNRRKFAGEVTAGWRAYDITGDKGTGIGAWSDDQVFAYLTTGHVLGHGTASGPMGEAVDKSFSQLTPGDMHAVVAYLRSVPPVSSKLPATLAPAAPPSHKQGAMVADARGKQVYEGACASCHDWTGVSPIIPLATLTGSRAVNDPSATNVAQIVISGTRRTTPQGTATMPAFGGAYSNAEIAAVANYVTARFGSEGSRLTERDVQDLRRQSAQ